MHLLPPPILAALKWILPIVGWLVVLYKKELETYFKAQVLRLKAWAHGYLTGGGPSPSAVKAILSSGLDELDRFSWYLLKEFHADRVTVVEYERQADGVVLVTCLSEARDGAMESIERSLQGTVVHPAIWAEAERIHALPGRKFFVPDAHLHDVAPMRDALLNSGVHSACYISLPVTREGKLTAMLSLSWHHASELSPQQWHALEFSSIACAYGLRIFLDLRKTKTT